MNRKAINQILQEMRERKTNHGTTTSPTLIGWADRIATLLDEPEVPEIATPRYRWACSTCGSFDIVCSANITWDYEQQIWVMAGDPLDDDYCENCEEEVRAVRQFD